jgi:hypothetical protein
MSFPARNATKFTDGTHDSKKAADGAQVSKMIHEHTTGGIPRWSPTLVLVARFSAYVWQSGRDAQFSLTYGRMYPIMFCNLYNPIVFCGRDLPS